MTWWAVITDDEHLCFGPYADEEKAMEVAERVSIEHDLVVRLVELQPYEEDKE